MCMQSTLEMHCHDLEVTGLNSDWVELGVHSTSCLSPVSKYSKCISLSESTFEITSDLYDNVAVPEFSIYNPRGTIQKIYQGIF